jgi:hypothetical protein
MAARGVLIGTIFALSKLRANRQGDDFSVVFFDHR